MAKKVTLEGEIGGEVGTWEVKNLLREAGGEDILVNFASPGGSVFTGLKIFNLFKMYEGNVDFHLIGEAASMGSYIPLAGRRITAEPNVVYMIHNARSFAGGDHNALRKRADIVEGLSSLLKNEYVKRTGMAESKVRAMMDAETFLFGPAAVEAGFIDEIIGEPDADPNAKSIHVATAKEAFEACMTKLQNEKADDYEKAAAMLIDPVARTRTEPETSATGEIEKGQTIMTLAELKAQHPELCAALLKEGAEAEKDRVGAFLVFGEASGDMKTAIEAINSGSEMTATLSAKFTMAAVAKRDTQDRTTDDTDAAGALDEVDTSTDDKAKDATANAALMANVSEICGVELGVKK